MSCSNPRYINSVTNILGRPVPIPCGVCNVCRATVIQNWSSRLTYEYNLNSSCFVCLTYDDNHLNYNRGFYRPTLKKSDLHKFVDNFRHFVKNHPIYLSTGENRKNFKWFAAGEYGEGGRPHIHICFFGLSPVFVKAFGYRCWHKGRVDVKPLLNGGIRYVLKYLEKKQNNEYALRDYFDKGLDEPFISFSPSIGSDYYVSQIGNISKYGCIKFGQKYVSIPPYWKNKLSVLSTSSIKSQKENLIKRYKEMNLEAKKHGFSDFSLYNEYLSSIKEKEIVTQLRLNGVATKNYSKFGHPISVPFGKSYDKYLLNQALEVYNEA